MPGLVGKYVQFNTINLFVISLLVEVFSVNKGLEGIKKTLKSLDGEIRKEYRAEIIGVFGSYVRGEQKEVSDLDILVRFTEGATLFDFVGLADFLEEKLHLKVDIVPERAVREELKEQIFRDLIRI